MDEFQLNHCSSFKKYRNIISIFNNIQSNASIELDQIIESSVNKANRNLDNLDFNNINLNTAKSLADLFSPDSSSKVSLVMDQDNTITQPGYVLMRNLVYNTSCDGYLNGDLIFHQYGSYGSWEDWNSIMIRVGTGDIVKLTGNGEMIFYPIKGAN